MSHKICGNESLAFMLARDNNFFCIHEYFLILFSSSIASNCLVVDICLLIENNNHPTRHKETTKVFFSIFLSNKLLRNFVHECMMLNQFLG